jgi:dTDP-4-amino-4,6-dideoxygalactose transaminase
MSVHLRVGRTVPPAAAPLGWIDLWHGIAGALRPVRSIRALEDEIRTEFRVRHVFAVSSGKAALALTLMALKARSSRRDVVIPAYTCFSVPAAVLKAGLRPVLCDIEPSTFDFDQAQLARTLNGDTLCVVAHHLFGVPAAIERIRALCAAHRIVLVEDAAQAMGVESGGRQLGTLGDVGIFSLGRGKNITCGSGGIIITSSGRLADAIGHLYRPLTAASRASQLTDFVRLVIMAIFIRPWLYWIPAALPFLGLGQTVFPKQIPLKRLSGMQAGLLRHWRRRLTGSNQGRAATAAWFRGELALQRSRDDAHPYLRLPIVAANAAEKDRLLALSHERGLGLSLAYPTPINEIPEIRSAFDGQRFPAARTVSERLLTLPTHHWVSDRDKRAIAELCRGVCAA